MRVSLLGPWLGIPNGTEYGIAVLTEVISDSGPANVGDLDEVEVSEDLREVSATGITMGWGLGAVGGYDPVPSYPKADVHRTAVELVAGGEGDQLIDQRFIFRDFRTGLANVPILESGYSIERNPFADPPASFNIRLYTGKFPAAVTFPPPNLVTADPGRTANAIPMEATQP